MMSTEFRADWVISLESSPARLTGPVGQGAIAGDSWSESHGGSAGDENVKCVGVTPSAGLYMQKGRETISGVDQSELHAAIARTCFSEIRLSRAEAHANKFGRLGIGVHRDFVLSRGGNPVFYVRHGDTDMITQNVAFLHARLQDMASKEGRTTEQEMLGALRQIMGFMKNMSERKNDAEFVLYDELEWRIVHSNTFERFFKVEDAATHIYRITVKPDDIKVLVFPDRDTRRLAISDSAIRQFFKDGFPMMATLNECRDL